MKRSSFGIGAVILAGTFYSGSAQANIYQLEKNEPVEIHGGRDMDDNLDSDVKRLKSRLGEDMCPPYFEPIAAGIMGTSVGIFFYSMFRQWRREEDSH